MRAIAAGVRVLSVDNHWTSDEQCHKIRGIV